jgi:hypothetical protein
MDAKLRHGLYNHQWTRFRRSVTQVAGPLPSGKAHFGFLNHEWTRIDTKVQTIFFLSSAGYLNSAGRSTPFGPSWKFLNRERLEVIRVY